MPVAAFPGASLVGSSALVALAGAAGGPAWALAAAVGAGAAVFGVRIGLPRSAHRAFRTGRIGRAARLYRLQRGLRCDRRARAQLEVSLAACAVAQSEFGAALAHLENADPKRLGESGRAAWLNNRAYARARCGVDLEGALADIDEALALRPDVSGFRHTRGVVVLNLGRVDEAIRELDAAWRTRPEGEGAPLEEAERCYDLGVAWLEKGEREYAADYFARAERAAPASPWSRLAAERLIEAGGAQSAAAASSTATAR